MKVVMEGVGVSPATFCLFDPLLRAPTFHPRTDASSSSVTRRPGGIGSLGWRAAKWAAILYNQTVVVHWGQFTGRLVQGLALAATSPLHSRGSPTPSAGTKSEVATSPLPSRGSPTKGTRSKWAQKRAEMLHHPCILGGPQRQARGQNQRGPKRGRRCYITPAFSGVPKQMGTKSELAA